MFKFVGKLFSGLLRTILLGAILLVGLAGGAYYWLIHNQLQKSLQEAQVQEGYLAHYDLVTRSKARVETSWPLTVRVAIKETQAHNWIPTEKHGLVKKILQWSPDQNQWVEEQHDSIPGATRLELEAMIQMTNGSLIEGLKDEDPVVREVAFRELKIRTDQDFGYRFDAREAQRKEAIARWEKWWEENKVRWTSRKVLEKVGEILE